jgi:hypothetical protein
LEGKEVSKNGVGRPASIGFARDMPVGEARALNQTDMVYRRSMELSNAEFLRRLRGEHFRAGRF